jgi:DNA polymerase III epsilon subunit-like protein
MAPSKRKAPAARQEILDSGYDATGIFDTETTGLLKPDVSDLDQQPRIIEFAISIQDRQYNIVEDHVWLINPGIEISEEITKITGITNDDLHDKPSFIEVLPEIIAVLRRLDRIIAHNCPFDHQMLINELKRIGQEFKFPYPPEWICTVQLAQELIYGRRARLIELYKDTMGKELEQTHRALDDVHALADVVRERRW